MTMPTDPRVRASFDETGLVHHLLLDHPRGNILDRAMIGALRGAIAESRKKPELRALVIEGAGKHFSFGASVEEHRAPVVGEMLRDFHGLFHDLADCGKYLIAIVRGQCLGGGLELAGFCHRVIASPDARLGNPEIKLGVFAPVASLVVPARAGQACADDLLITGRSVVADEALRMGLIDAITDDPSAAAAAWVKEHLAPISSVALTHALRASRHAFYGTFFPALRALEDQYLSQLMPTADANEGIAAFIEKRSPSWKHR